jgi:hypothetical protein
MNTTIKYPVEVNPNPEYPNGEYVVYYECRINGKCTFDGYKSFEQAKHKYDYIINNTTKYIRIKLEIWRLFGVYESEEDANADNLIAEDELVYPITDDIPIDRSCYGFS